MDFNNNDDKDLQQNDLPEADGEASEDTVVEADGEAVAETAEDSVIEADGEAAGDTAEETDEEAAAATPAQDDDDSSSALSSPEPDEDTDTDTKKKSKSGLGTKLLAPIKNKKFRYGAYSSVISLVMVAVLIAVNLVVGQFDHTFDLTSDQLYSIGDTTLSVLDSLEEDITIYTLYETGEEVQVYAEILDQYAANSSHITIVNKDPYINLSFVEQYQTDDTAISVNSIIVVSDKRYKVIDSSELISTSYAYDSSYNIVTETTTDIESKTTNAIVYVTQTTTPVIYTLTGHNETELSSTMQTTLKDANYDIGTVNLMTGDIPDDCSVLIVTTPDQDISEDEADKLLAYLQGGGRAMFLIDKTSVDMPNLETVVNAYGVSFGDYLVYEGDADYYYGYPYWFFPQISDHSINTSILESGYPVFIYEAQSVETLSTTKSSLTIERLLSTTDEGYAKTTDSAESINKSTGDLDGPFDVAVAITDTFTIGSDTTVSKLVVVGNSSIIDPDYDIYGANTEFIVNALGWLTDKSDADTVYVASKSLSSSGTETVTITAGAQVMIIVYSIIILPVGIMIIGIVVWLRRRNR